MDNNSLKNIIDNFNGSDWINDYENNIHTYKEDYNLQLKLGMKIDRKKDELFEGNQWDDFFNTNNSTEIIEVEFFYRDSVISKHTYVLTKSKVIIPLPVGANMIDSFYDSEFELAKMLTKEENMFKTLLNTAKLQKKTY